MEVPTIEGERGGGRGGERESTCTKCKVPIFQLLKLRFHEHWATLFHTRFLLGSDMIPILFLLSSYMVPNRFLLGSYMVTTRQISFTLSLVIAFLPLSTSVCYPNPQTRDGILKFLKSPGIDSKESIPPAYKAWRAGKKRSFYSVPSPHRLL
jgi:hypothetical protein